MTDSRQSIATVPVLIINGFLGSGKTTLLRGLIAKANKENLRTAIIVNDMSELDVDGVLVGDADVLGEHGCYFKSIHDCVLSSNKGIAQLELALEEIALNPLPDLVIIETSGSCHPMPLVEFFSSQNQFRLTGVLALVDSAMMDQDYDAGSQLLSKFQTNLEAQQRDTTNLLVEQIMFCSHLVLTKADRIDGGKLQLIAKHIHEVNPYVAVVSVTWGNLPMDDVLAMPDYDFHRVGQLITELKPVLAKEQLDERPYNLATRVIKDDRPFHPQRLWETCQQHLGQHIYRSKGFFYLASRDEVSLLWNQAAGGISLELIGYWRAGILEDTGSTLDAKEKEGLRKRIAKEGGRFGDRRCNLTVIGDKTQVDTFADLLTQCFLTEDEIRDWQAGGTFPDPWPDNYATKKY